MCEVPRPPVTEWPVHRILLLGDVHGNTAFLEHAFAAAGRHGCDAIIQLGDLGYWDHTKAGREFLDRAQSSAKLCDIPLLFVDGNHENHEMLGVLIDEDRVDRDGIAWVRPDVGWLTRGARWEWGDVRFGALGGAASVDRDRRVQGWSWWAEEVCTDSDAALLGIDPLDVLVTHDAPLSVALKGRADVHKEDLERCTASRGVLDRAVRRLRPTLVVHGHWHQRHTTESLGARIEGLASDGESFTQAAVVLHVPSLDVSEVAYSN